MIEIEAVTRRYGEYLAVDDVSFSIGQGEIVGLLGHNGAGKTTIMKMMTGFLEPTAGRIFIDGKEIGEARQPIQRSIGYLPENCPVYPEMTVVDYLDYVASLHGVNAEARQGMLSEAIARTGLKEKAMQPIGNLSRGYRQRTGVAQAILHKPKILILDEPTNGLDPTQIHQMRSLITELAKSATVIVSTHILQEVQAVCDRVIILKGGKKVVDSRLDELERDRRLQLIIDSGKDDALSFLRGCDNVRAVEKKASASGDNGKGTRYLLQLSDKVADQDTAAGLAGLVCGRGWKLYGMQFGSRDLETVFAEVSAAGGNDASAAGKAEVAAELKEEKR